MFELQKRLNCAGQTSVDGLKARLSICVLFVTICRAKMIHMQHFRKCMKNKRRYL